MTAESLSAVVHGRVQGVGFRFFVYHHARALGLRGFVRNLADGSVEVYAEGARAALEDLRRLLGEGPSAAVVTRVDARFGEARGRVSDFDID